MKAIAWAGSAAAAVLAGIALSGPASAQLSTQGTGNCRVGGAVSTRDGRTGVVDKAEGNSCWVKFADGSRDYFLQWMLTPAKGGGPAAAARGGARAAAPAGKAGGRAPDGNYQCYGGQAGNMRITIKGGLWQGFYAEALPDGKVGLSSRPDGKPYYMVCERR